LALFTKEFENFPHIVKPDVAITPNSRQGWF